MVPADWQHPKDAQGHYIPLLDGFSKNLADWEEENAKWTKGFRRDYGTNGWRRKEKEYRATPFEEWSGQKPEANDYMPDWPKEKQTHLCMYEDCSEGTPISPVFATPEECAHWLADNSASAFGAMTATYEQWLATCKAGYAIGCAFGGGKGLRSGVELNAE